MLQVARRTGAVIEGRAGRLARPDLARCAGVDDRSAGAADCAHACADLGGVVNPAATGGRDRAAAWGAISVGCVPIGRPDACRCGRDRLRHAVRDGSEILRGPRRDRIPVCAAENDRSAGAADAGSAFRDWTGPETYVLRDDARRFETFEGHVAGRIGLGVAVEYALALGLRAIHDRVRGLAEHLREKLASVSG